MGKAVDELLALMPAGAGFAPSHGEVRQLQLAALDERLQDQGRQIRLVRSRAEEAVIAAIRSFADIVPLLLPHTAYKSYPESFLVEQRWDRLTRWLGTVTTRPTGDVDLTGVSDIDQWADACAAAGHFVSCSSGTTGKPAMLPSAQSDLDFAAAENVAAVEWGSAIRTGDRRVMAGHGTVARNPRNSATGGALIQAFADPARLKPSSAPAITVGSITGMIALRKAIADGTARPEQIAAYEQEGAARAAALEAVFAGAVEHIVANRHERLLIMAMWGPLYQLAEAVRARGLSARDFHGENAVFLGGGLKRAQVPPNYREYVYETFNLAPPFIYQMYGMQETQSSMPRCPHGRYHVPAWMVCLPLDAPGEALLPTDAGEIEGRAAFFDLSIEGRWGGVISGDRISVDFRPCACGAGSPSIADNIARYADLEGDDKIACSGTVDAYVRGLA